MSEKDLLEQLLAEEAARLRAEPDDSAAALADFKVRLRDLRIRQAAQDGGGLQAPEPEYLGFGGM